MGTKIPEGLMKILIFSLLTILIVGTALAGKPQDFVGQLSRKIYADCYGIDIVIKSDKTFYFKDNNEQLIKKIPWPYELKAIESLISALTNGEPYALVGPGATISSGLNAINAITCGDHNLSVNFDNYYWDNEQFELIRSLEIHTDGGDFVHQGTNSIFQKTIGEHSPAIIGDNNKVDASKKRFSFLENAYFSLTISFSLIISIVLNISLGIKFRQKNKITINENIQDDE